MKPVTRQDIEAAWERLCDMSEEQTEALVKSFMNEQPALGVYLFASSESLEAGSLQESPLIDLVIASWQTLTQAAGRRLNQVTPEQIELAEATNTKALEQLEMLPKSNKNGASSKPSKAIPSENCLDSEVEILMSGHEENPELGSRKHWHGTALAQNRH